MDRVRLMLLGIATVSAALLAAPMIRRPAASHESAMQRPPAAPDYSPAYPPRLLELPEGVVPVSLHFEPPPLPEAPAKADSQHLASTPEAMPQLSDPLRLPPPDSSFRSDNAIQAARASAFDSATLAEPLPAPEIADHEDQRSLEAAGTPALRLPTLAEPAASSHFFPIADSTPSGRQIAAVESRVAAMVRDAFSLAERGASYTARGQLVQALRLISQSLDATQGGTTHSESLAAAFRALEEGEDFQLATGRPETTANVANLVASHRTPALQGAELARITPLEAMQRYYTYAQEQFAAAGGGSKAASLALFGLGKLHDAPAGATGAAPSAPKAMVFHQAALLVDPQNHLAANELGVLLAKCEQWEDAKRMLLHSLGVHPVAQTWHNLAVVHEQLGETDLLNRARFEMAQLQQKQPTVAIAPAGPVVRWTTPTEFALTGGPGAPPRILPHEPRTVQSISKSADGSEWWKPWTWF